MKRAIDWIPVEEGLPKTVKQRTDKDTVAHICYKYDDSENVLCTLSDGTIAIGFYCHTWAFHAQTHDNDYRYSETDNWFIPSLQGGAEREIDVVAWTALPAPYKPTRNGKEIVAED